MAERDPWEQEEEDLTWAQAVVQGGQNLPISTVRAGADIVEALSHPIETGHTLIKLMSGGLQLLLPDEVVNLIDPEGKSAESQQMALAVGQYFQDKYKNEESIKHVVATDPASVLMDIATVLSGGGAIMSKTGQLTNIAKAKRGTKEYKPNLTEKTGAALTTAGTLTDPFTGLLKGGEFVATKTGKVAGEIVGGTSGTGGAAVANVFDVARESAAEGSIGTKGDRIGRGEDGQTLTTAIRQGSDLEGVLQTALRDLDVMRSNKQANYRKDKDLWSKDVTELKFTEIDAAMARAEKIVKYKGTIKNAEGVKALKKLEDIITEYKGNDPRTHHTVEGFDAMKQTMWSVVEDTPMDNATARGVAQNIYHATGDTIKAQAPGYASAMKEFMEASDLIKQIEQTLSLKKGANVDTAIRKLNSIMRDNVNTNYGQRMKLARQLEDVGGEKFIAELAGQQFSSAMPRGIQGAVTPGVSTVAAVGGAIDPISYGATLLASSPKVVGKTANLTGYIMGKLDKLPTPKYEGIAGLLEMLYQLQAQTENKQNQ